MTKKLLFSLTLTLFFLNVNSQNTQVWTKHNNSLGKITLDKSATRDNFPKVFQLFDLNINPLRQELFSVINKGGKSTTIISLPNADGQMELFEVNDASKCMSGQVFPNAEMCLNPTLSPNMQPKQPTQQHPLKSIKSNPDRSTW